MHDGPLGYCNATTGPTQAPLKTCNQIVYWSAGGYFDGQGQALTHCEGCGEWLGTPFVRAEESHWPAHGAKPRLHLQAS